MAQLAIRVTDDEALAMPAIDHDHLATMTFGDRRLERELLQLFDRQAVILLDRMRSADGPALAALAHTLKGSAAGIGATGVAAAASAVEEASTAGPSARATAVAGLSAAIVAARSAIAAMLRDA